MGRCGSDICFIQFHYITEKRKAGKWAYQLQIGTMQMFFGSQLFGIWQICFHRHNVICNGYYPFSTGKSIKFISWVQSLDLCSNYESATRKSMPYYINFSFGAHLNTPAAMGQELLSTASVSIKYQEKDISSYRFW